MNKDFSCGNCKYFMQHYYWFKYKLKNAYSGHCVGHRKPRLVEVNGYCDKWELTETGQQPQKANIENILLQMAKQVEDIAAILKCEN